MKHQYYRIQAMNLPAKAMIIFFLLFPVANAELPGDLSAGEQIRQEILDWLDSIKSLQFKFRYRFDVPPDFWKDLEIEYRWQNDMVYYESLLLGIGGPGTEPVGTVLTEARVDGKWSVLAHQSQAGVTGEVNRERSVISYTNLIELLFNKIPLNEVASTSPDELGLHTILSVPGKTALIEKGGQRILIYWSDSEALQGIAVNVHLGKRNLVTRVDYVVRPFYSPEEVQQWATVDIHEVVQKWSSVVFSDYRQFNGIWFPCSMKQTEYSPTLESRLQYSSLKANARRDNRSLCEYYVKLYEGLVYDERKARTYEASIDFGTMRINEILARSDFEIDIPRGTGVVNQETDEIFYVGQATWLERHADLVIILIALGILGGITVAGWRYWLGKP